MDRRTTAARPAEIEAEESAPPGAESVRIALAEGRPAAAARAYFALPASSTRGLLSADEAVALATWLREGGHAEAALALLRQASRDLPRGAGLARLQALAGEVLLEDLGQPTAAYPYLLAALEMGPLPETAARARRGLAAIEALQKRRIGRLHSTL